MFKVISSFIIALPELLRLIKNIQRGIEEQNTNKKVKDDIKKINEAFANRDAELLNRVFNGVPANDKETR